VIIAARVPRAAITPFTPLSGMSSSAVTENDLFLMLTALLGTHQVRMEFAYDGGGLAKGGDVTLYYDGTAVGSGRVEATQAMIFSADETTDIGHETGTTVTPDYTAQSSRFTGKINWVQVDLGDDDHDHFIDPEERLRIAIARQ
jgi:hypothetical protein